MKADFFIDRPVFSTVLSIIIVIVGFIGLALLPVDQYPQIVPPVVRISASYPGADAQTVTQAVATPIEQELNGTPGMIYMESSSSNSGGFSATVTFDISTDPDLAAVDIQNRLKKAEARLPAEVVQNGISVEKQAASKLMTITLLRPTPSSMKSTFRTMRRSTCWTCCAACPAWAAFRTSAAVITPCRYGSCPTNWPTLG